MCLSHMGGTHLGRPHRTLCERGRERTDSRSRDKLCFHRLAGISPIHNLCMQPGPPPRGNDPQNKQCSHVPMSRVCIDPPRTLRSARASYERMACAVAPAGRPCRNQCSPPARCVSGIDPSCIRCKLIAPTTRRSDRSSNPRSWRRPQLACCDRQGSWNIHLVSLPRSACVLCLRRNGSRTLCS